MSFKYEPSYFTSVFENYTERQNLRKFFESGEFERTYISCLLAVVYHYSIYRFTGRDIVVREPDNEEIEGKLMKYKG